MSRDILGIYRGKERSRTGATAHTPDPAKYHDAAAERLEGESAAGATVLNKLPGNHGFSKLRGVIIPRATPLGGSRGHDHLKPAVIHIDPGPYGEGGLRVDLAQVGREEMAAAVEESAARANDLEDMAYNAFAAVAGHAQPAQPGRREEERAPEEERRAPLQMPGTYVVPKASPGGGQQVKRASFTDRQLRERDEEVRRQQQSAPKAYHARQAQASMGSLQAALDGSPPAGPGGVGAEPAGPPTQVTFEIPGGHQFHVLYHDVVRQGMTLVLVYDHNRPFQLVYFPPPMEDDQGEPVCMALLVHARPRSGDKTMLYRVQCPGIQFKFQGREFCVLLIDKEKEMGPEGKDHEQA